jgi:beta-1,4-N-acetylglucosaminyltransferase
MTPCTWHEERRTCLAFSPGGHRAELERALAGITFADVFHVTFDDGRALPAGDDGRAVLAGDDGRAVPAGDDGRALPAGDDGRNRPDGPRCYKLCHPRRSLWRTALNAWQSLRVLHRERPALMISTGADVAVPILLLAKLFGATVVFIETAGSAAPTLAGRLVYPVADLFIVQWPERLERFPKAVLAEGLLL